MSEDGQRRRRRSGSAAGGRRGETEEEYLRRMRLRRAAQQRRRRERRRKVFLMRTCLAAALCVCVICIVAAASSRMQEEMLKIRWRRQNSGGSGQTTANSGSAGEGQTGDEASGVQNGTVQDAVSITVSAAGDCTLGTDENFDYSTSFNRYTYRQTERHIFFQNVKSIFEADDLTIVNMEGTLTDETDRQDKTFAFKGAGEYAQVLTEGSVEAANLANNHSHDYGDQSYIDTIGYLGSDGIISFGYDRTSVMDVNGVKVGLGRRL